MSRPLSAITLCFIALLSFAQTGEDIARKVDEANAGFVGEYAEMEMLLINAHGDTITRKLIAETAEVADDGDRSISTFLWPADVKGTRMLTWSHKTGDDDQWLYLPALKRVKRISSRNKSGSFMGSEFSYEDLGSQEVEEYTYKMVEEAKTQDRDCWVVDREPVSKRSGYSKERVWWDKEYLNPLRVEYYDRKGDLLKVADFKDYQKIDKYYRVGKIEVENVQTKKRSVLTWTKRELGKAYSEYHFDSESLIE